MNITSGRTRTTSAKIYDRLRKRSYRSTTSRYVFAGDRVHAAYVAGVRDALNAMSAMQEDA